MEIEHYIIFVGASAALSEELSELKDRITRSYIIAPAAKRGSTGITDSAIESVSRELYEKFLMDENPSCKARLYIWTYEPNSLENLNSIWKIFGHSPWVETIPACYKHKIIDTKKYIENRTGELRRLLHRISHAVFAQRKTSPLSLPLQNFESEITTDLKAYWYHQLDEMQLSSKIDKLRNRYRQTRVINRGYRDDRTLIFKPAADNECHGRPHPRGSEAKSFFCGRFRYGVSLFPGFHFDVSEEHSPTIQHMLSTLSGDKESFNGRGYVNIFPNDLILPEN